MLNEVNLIVCKFDINVLMGLVSHPANNNPPSVGALWATEEIELRSDRPSVVSP